MVRQMLMASPEHYGYARTRWTLAMLSRELRKQFASWSLHECHYSIGATWQLLKRLRIRHRRSQPHMRSPDPEYVAKEARCQDLLTRAKEQKIRLFYLDEATYHRIPTPAKAWQPMELGQPRAEQGNKSDSTLRVAGLLDARTGRVVYEMRNRLSIPTFQDLFQHVVQLYPDETLYIVTDNWSIHFHADVLAMMIEQPHKAEFKRPKGWSDTPKPTTRRRNLPIILVPLPTYSPWLNPIEKLWGKSRRDISHLHRFAEDIDQLRQRLHAFFAQFKDGSSDLLQTVGLLSA